MGIAKQVELLVGERNSRESRKAMIACNDYLRLGPGRSLELLASKYNGLKQSESPTRSKSTLGKWSMDHQWQARAEAYDAVLEARKTEESEKRRVEILNTGFALDYERVSALKEIADLLLNDIQEQTTIAPSDISKLATQGVSATVRPNVWLRDVKQIGSGEKSERVDIVRFNAALFEQFRAALDDIAKETGGRVQKTDNKIDLVGKISVVYEDVLSDDNDGDR